MLATLHAASVETQVFREGLALLETSQFQSERLVHLNRAVYGASTAVRKLERLFNALNERNKEWFYGPSLLILFATQMCMALEDWRRLHGSQLPVWLDAWAEFEALNSLANYAWENPANRYPAINSSATLFEAKALGHPLIPAANCVCNEVRLNAETRFFIISGSNMSGKSTLMRAIGLNTVLALAGAPVRAESLTLSPLHICASLSVVDSLQNGTSKFLAEMERLRLTLTTASCSPVLFLIDEIFSGTNSPDRRTASEAVVRTLITRGAIGALSTHDLTLTEIAEVPELFGANVHMGSREGGGPMDFDYLLKPGITKETNALAIARMAGVPV
jgi:DNA mismatch repair ATPase MutS